MLNLISKLSFNGYFNDRDLTHYTKHSRRKLRQQSIFPNDVERIVIDGENSVHVPSRKTNSAELYVGLSSKRKSGKVLCVVAGIDKETRKPNIIITVYEATIAALKDQFGKHYKGEQQEKLFGLLKKISNMKKRR